MLIATPGRLLDHVERGKLLMTGVQMMVVDEADRMLDMGFIPDIERIFKLTPPKKQTLFFSATMPPEITRLTKQFLNDPVRIEASKPATTGENIAQHLVRIPVSDPKAKRMALRALIDASEIKNGIVFCNRKSEVDVVAKSLKAHGHDAAAIHGDLDQSVRTKTLEGFRKGELKLLVASDVAARGLDIPDVSHVFNFDVPHHADDYVHRIGRTGRAGRSGDTFMIVTPADSRNLDKVLKLIGKVPAETVLDLDWSQASGGDERRRDGRSSSRERPARREGRSSSSRERPRAEAAADRPEIAETVEAAPRPARRAPSSREAPVRDAPVREAPVREASAGEDAAPRRARSAPRPARLAPEAPRPARLAPEPPPRPVRPVPEAPQPQRRDRDDHEENGVRGFGDDVPAFLLRPIPKMAEAKSE